MITPSGGYQLFFKYSELIDRYPVESPDVEVKNNLKYVLVSPSRDPISGRPYPTFSVDHKDLLDWNRLCAVQHGRPPRLLLPIHYTMAMKFLQLRNYEFRRGWHWLCDPNSLVWDRIYGRRSLAFTILDTLKAAGSCGSLTDMDDLLQCIEILSIVGRIDERSRICPYIGIAPNMSFDLRTGRVIPRQVSHYLRHQFSAPYDPAAKSSLLEKLVRDLSLGDEVMQAFIPALFVDALCVEDGPYTLCCYGTNKVGWHVLINTFVNSVQGVRKHFEARGRREKPSVLGDGVLLIPSFTRFVRMPKEINERYCDKEALWTVVSDKQHRSALLNMILTAGQLLAARQFELQVPELVLHYTRHMVGEPDDLISDFIKSCLIIDERAYTKPDVLTKAVWRWLESVVGLESPLNWQLAIVSRIEHLDCRLRQCEKLP